MNSSHKAKNALGSSLSLGVERVWIVKNGNAEIIPLKGVVTGDVVRVQCGSMIPVDGIVVSGEAGVNESSMTGESLPCHKKSGLRVYAGTVIEEGELDIKVTDLPDNSRISKIVELIESSENLKSNIQTKAETFADSLVPFSLITEKAVKIDAICFDRILMRFLSIFEKFDLTKKQ